MKNVKPTKNWHQDFVQGQEDWAGTEDCLKDFLVPARDDWWIVLVGLAVTFLVSIHVCEKI